VAAVRERFGGRVTYAAIPLERVDWAPFDIVSVELIRSAEVAGKPLPAGALLLEDTGCFSGQRLQDAGEQGVYVLTRVPAWTAFFDARGRRLDRE